VGLVAVGFVLTATSIALIGILPLVLLLAGAFTA